MIQIEGLYKSYSDVPVLEDVRLRIAKGSIYGLAGRSGVGKSTLLRCMNGLERFDSGSLIVDGTELKGIPKRELNTLRRNIGMIFQQFSLLERITVYENIALPMKWKKYSRAAIDLRVKELLELVGIPEKLGQKPRDLSGGQKQRVAIARALTMNPKVLLCDEATSALDPKTADSILTLLRDINTQMGVTIVIVTHQMETLRKVCHRVALLERGQVREEGSTREVFLRQSPAFLNLVGGAEKILPSTGVNLQIILEDNQGDLPIASRMARDLDIDFNVCDSEFERFTDGVSGYLTINLAPQHCDLVRRYLDDRGIGCRIANGNEGKENV